MRIIKEKQLTDFCLYMKEAEHASATVSKYKRTIEDLMLWMGGREVTKELVVAWKEHILERNYAPATVNGMLTAVNVFFKHYGWHDCIVKMLRLQRRAFRDPGRDLTKEEYDQLVDTAYSLGKTRLALIMETICATGIRVSELRFVTVEAVQREKAEIRLKGKIRAIMLPGKLCRKLLKYARKKKIASGEIFLTRSGKSLGRHQIWSEMKSVCAAAGVNPSKVFPHNLRHLFATVFYRSCHDIVKLADVLGHSSIETTRIYLITTGEEHARMLNQLGLVS